MRKELRKINNQRLRFKGRVERFGTKVNYKGFPEPTLLLVNVQRTDTGQQVTDHLWFNVGKTIAGLRLEYGDVVEFDARVSMYQKGYVNFRERVDERTWDYRLSYPTKFIKCDRRSRFESALLAC